MAVYVKKYLMSPGSYYFIDPALTNVTILHVSRGRFSYVQTGNEAASDLQYIYSAATGSITFDQNNPFILNDALIGGGSYIDNVEKILVTYKV